MVSLHSNKNLTKTSCKHKLLFNWNICETKDALLMAAQEPKVKSGKRIYSHPSIREELRKPNFGIKTD